MATYLQNSGKHYTGLAPNVWCDNFKIYSLVEIMRQKEEKKFCEILNRLLKDNAQRKTTKSLNPA